MTHDAKVAADPPHTKGSASLAMGVGFDPLILFYIIRGRRCCGGENLYNSPILRTHPPSSRLLSFLFLSALSSPFLISTPSSLYSGLDRYGWYLQRSRTRVGRQEEVEM